MENAERELLQGNEESFCGWAEDPRGELLPVADSVKIFHLFKYDVTSPGNMVLTILSPAVLKLMVSLFSVRLQLPINVIVMWQYHIIVDVYTSRVPQEDEEEAG